MANSEAGRGKAVLVEKKKKNMWMKRVESPARLPRKQDKHAMLKKKVLPHGRE